MIQFVIMITPESPLSRKLQAVAEATNGVITPANTVDAVAFGAAIHAGPRLDTWGGIGEAAAAYGADLVDGKIARATGTSNDVGARVDAVGDKLKLVWGMYHAVKGNLVDRDVVAVVAAQNAANAAVTFYDRYRNEEPTITAAQKLGKRAMFGQAMGLGVQIIGTRAARDGNERVGNAMRTAGRWLALGTAATFGVASTVDYIRTARTGIPKQRQPREHRLSQVHDLGDGNWETKAARARKTHDCGPQTNVTRRGIEGDVR